MAILAAWASGNWHRGSIYLCFILALSTQKVGEFGVYTFFCDETLHLCITLTTTAKVWRL
jgi:hypothetical protein